MGQQDDTGTNSKSGPDVQVLDHVLDISSWQPPSVLDWPKIKERNSDLAAVYVKASEGVGYQNPYRKAQGMGALGKRFQVGYYHYARPSWGSAADQADFFLKSQPPWPTLRPMLDLEWGDSIKGPPLYLWIHNFCERIHKRIGCRPILYTYPAWWEGYIVNAGALHQEAVNYLQDRLLWIAHYGASSPRVPPPFTHWSLWQYTSTKTRQGINDPTVDDSYLGVRINQIRLSQLQRLRATRLSK